MADMKTSVVLDLTGNLSRRADQYGRSLQRMGKMGTRSMQTLNRSMKKVGQGMEAMGSRYTAMASGLATGAAVRGVVQLEQRLVRMGIQAGKSAEEVNRIKEAVFDAAQQKDIRVEPAQILAAIDAIVEKTGDLDFADKNIRNIGLAIQATGADGGAIGEILAEFQKLGITAPAEVMKALDVMNVQGKAGAFTLEHLAALGPRVINAYAATGRTGAEALREMGAALQVIRMGTGSSEQAATAFEAVLRTLTDPAKIKQLRRLGVEVFDPTAMKEGVEKLRLINELMTEIVAKSKGKVTTLGSIFDAEAMRSFNKSISDYQTAGEQTNLKKFMGVEADGTTTTKDSARAAETASAALTYLKTSLERFADNQLADDISRLADAINELDPATVERIFKGIVLGVGSLMAYSAGAKVVRGARSLFGGGGGGAAAAGMAGARGMTRPRHCMWPWSAVAGALCLGEMALIRRAGASLKSAGVVGAGRNSAMPSVNMEARC